MHARTPLGTYYVVVTFSSLFPPRFCLVHFMHSHDAFGDIVGLISSVWTEAGESACPRAFQLPS